MSTEIFYADGTSEKLQAAFRQAQKTFKFFWRESYWEQRRIVPALNISCVKVAFTDTSADTKEQIVEHMWINDVYFDGETIVGTLLNEPADVTNVAQGDSVSIPLQSVSDWLFCSGDKTYGGFTIQAMRSEMSEDERAEHDAAWGLNFGDYHDILVAYEQKEHPENLVEHPMSVNMKQNFIDYIAENPDMRQGVDEQGNTWVHTESIAGNLSLVEALAEAQFPLHLKNKHGKTALDYAKECGWDHIVAFLQSKSA